MSVCTSVCNECVVAKWSALDCMFLGVNGVMVTESISGVVLLFQECVRSEWMDVVQMLLICAVTPIVTKYQYIFY